MQVLPIMSGVQRVSLELFKAMPREWDKYVMFSSDVSPEARAQCDKEFRDAGVTVIYSDHLGRAISHRDIKAIREIYRFCRDQKFDIVHTNSTKPGVVGRIGAVFAHTPIVIHTVHGLAFHKYVKFPKWQFYWACEMLSSFFCDRIVSVNKYYLRYFKLFGRKTSTIYNGIDTSRYKADPELIQNKGDGKRLVFVGRLDFPKDPLTLVRAVEIVSKSVPDVHLDMIGSGEYYDRCADYIASHGLQNNISLLGWQDDPSSFYKKSDIFVSSSIYEAFGLTFVEAGVSGLPVVTTNVEGIPEVVRDNVTGLLCNPKDPQALAANILRLINDRDMRIRMGMEAQRICCAEFDKSKMTRRYMELYEEMLRKKNLV